jgi:hypothetical protein
MLWILPGFIGSIAAYNLYPPLIGDSGTRPIWLMALFVLAIVLPRLWNLFRSRPIDDTASPAPHAVSSMAFALVALALLLNGVLDRRPPNEERATVLRKVVTMSKYTHYHMIVTSWRPGHSQEGFDVDAGVYRSVAVGKTVSVEIHKGFLGLPWLGNISPE